MTSKSIHFYTVPSVHHIFCMQKSKTLLGSKKNNNVVFLETIILNIFFLFSNTFLEAFSAQIGLLLYFFDWKFTHNK